MSAVPVVAPSSPVAAPVAGAASTFALMNLDGDGSVFDWEIVRTTLLAAENVTTDGVRESSRSWSTW